MCHQSVGLIARALEIAGTPTVSLTSAWSITASAGAPRALFTDFPLGNTAGPPHDPATQRAIAHAAVEAFAGITTPGSITPFDHEWPGDWKVDARDERDHRTERKADPQYQMEIDRAAAIANHGEEAACGVCSPS